MMDFPIRRTTLAKLPVSTIAIAALWIYPQFLGASTLYYGGDSGPTDITVSNEENTTVADARVYDNFTVPNGQAWNVSGLFSNDSLSNGLTTITQALWEIRTGVSEGNGGALLFSGMSAASQIATGRTDVFGNPEYTIGVSVSFVLGPGTYWITVVPSDSGTGRASAITSVNQTNMVGTHIYGNDFFSSTYYGDNFVNTLTLSPGESMLGNFSDGVTGSVTAIP